MARVKRAASPTSPAASRTDRSSSATREARPSRTRRGGPGAVALAPGPGAPARRSGGSPSARPKPRAASAVRVASQNLSSILRMWPSVWPTFCTLWMTASFQANVPALPGMLVGRLAVYRDLRFPVAEVDAHAVRVAVARLDLARGKVDVEHPHEVVLERQPVRVSGHLRGSSGSSVDWDCAQRPSARTATAAASSAILRGFTMNLPFEFAHNIPLDAHRSGGDLDGSRVARSRTSRPVPPECHRRVPIAPRDYRATLRVDRAPGF